MGKRKDKTKGDDYIKSRKKFRRAAAKHVLVCESKMDNDLTLETFRQSELIRKAGNELTGIMKKKYEQLIRTKRYRKLRKLYGETEDKAKKEDFGSQMTEMRKKYGVTWDVCRTTMIPIGEKYGVKAVFALTKAEDVWKSVEKCLFGNGKTIHFSKYGEYPSIRAKQITRAIVMKVVDGKLVFSLDGKEFRIIVDDRFRTDEVNAILNYLEQPEVNDRKAVGEYLATGKTTDTHRPCCATLVPRVIRGRKRVFLHLTVEGKACRKFDKDGNPRHHYGTGTVGGDIGTQTVAYTSKKEVGLKNLAELGSSITENERKERLLYRAMDRSRRAMNPGNYNKDGTIRKGKKTWVYSKHYKKLRSRHSELCRINAVNRQLAINADANHMRELGDVFITEPKNAAKLMKRVKKTTINKNGKPNRKKRFGKSIKNRCPGGFQATVKKKFESTGGKYIEVPADYRASQYDHTADAYIKKKLSQRMYKLSDGTEVQRDWYSSFLLYCCDQKTQTIDRTRCITEFEEHHVKEKALIERIKANHIRVLNSGIKAA